MIKGEECLICCCQLQPPKFDGREAADRVATPGASVGLVWTTFGGEVQFVEATTMVGKGELHLTVAG